MSKWSNENTSCIKTWITLKELDQIDKNFEQSGDIKMEELTFWNSSTSEEMRNIQANTIAIEMDKIFIKDGSKYELSSNKEKSINEIVKTLLVSDKTINDLASINDINYKFYKENEY
jgi:hypothetical protein